MRKLIAVFFALLTAMSGAHAQNEDGCLGPIANLRGSAPVMNASLTSEEVQITFIGHSTFLIESPKGVRIATDYNDYVRPRAIPDIATMNHAHDTHYTNNPDPRIPHVLKGWGSEGDQARHNVQFQDVHVRNVPTNIRSFSGNTEFYGNSIFVFEISGLCVAHLGHLHHTLSKEHLRALGKIDVVMVPVDGSWTMDVNGMIEVLEALKAPMMIPMHYFSQSALNRFLTQLGDRFTIKRQDNPAIIISRATLPERPTLVVLPGR